MHSLHTNAPMHVLDMRSLWHCLLIFTGGVGKRELTWQLSPRAHSRPCHHADPGPVLAGKLKVLPAVDITPTMTCRVRMIQVSAILRVSLAPVLPDLPFVGAVSLSLMTPPYLDFDLRRALHHARPLR